MKVVAAEVRGLRERCDRAMALCVVATGKIRLGDDAGAIATVEQISRTLTHTEV